MLAAIWSILMGLFAGWIVNLLADTIPTRQPIRTTRTWLFGAWIFQRLGILQGELGDTLTAKNAPLLPTRRYWFVWLASILLGWFALMRLGWTPKALLVAVEAWFFLAIAVIDLEHRIVPNRMLLAATPFVLLTNLLLGKMALTSILFGAAAGFGFFLILALLAPGGLGMGDVKLAGLIGLTTGLSSVLTALFIGILAGGVAGAVILLRDRFRHHLHRGQTMAYAPYLVVGVWVILLDGIQLLHNYLERL